MKTVTKQDILFSLKLLGISNGDVLLVHSALTSIGYVEGGADTVIDALIESVGPDGTLVMSTLTNWDTNFDADSSKSAVGIISEKFRKREGVLRSLHPVHSVAALGAQAKHIIADHDKCQTGCGNGTPYQKIIELSGKIMLLGVDLDRNTVMHTVEETAESKYLIELAIPAPVYPPYNGKGDFILKKFPPGHRDFICVNSDIRRAGIMSEVYIGNALTKVIDAKGLFDMLVPMAKEDPMIFICNNENCNFCNYIRNRENHKEIDYSRYKNNGCQDQNCEICVIRDEHYVYYGKEGQ